VTIKLRKTRCFPVRIEFGGVDVTKDGNSPAKSKHEALRGTERPVLSTDLSMLIRFIGFHRNWIPSCETRIKRWRDCQKKQPAPGAVSKDAEAQTLKELQINDDHTCC
jgi:hypothetical protein